MKSVFRFVRSLVIAAIVTASTLAATNVATAGGPNLPTPWSEVASVHHYYVYFFCDDEWELHECYECPVKAKKASLKLQQQGHRTVIVYK